MRRKEFFSAFRSFCQQHNGSGDQIVMFKNIWQELENPARFRNVDCLRAFAILSVVVLHFDLVRFHYGGLGVDLFFVLSGFLVSQPLFRARDRQEPTHFWKFVSRRAVRIIPSYFAFLLLGGVLAWALYRRSHPEYLIQAAEWPRYFLFYYNYAPLPHFIFNHIWSICVEEHFYILLPIGFIFLQKTSSNWLAASLAMAVVSVLVLKIILFNHNGYHAYAVTHGRLDSLVIGVLTRFAYESKKFRILEGNKLFFLFGVFCLIATIALDCISGPQSFFSRVGLNFFSPLAFAILLMGSLGWSLRKTQMLRFVSYFSYNWYLWHLLLSTLIFERFDKGLLGFVIYVCSGFILGFIANRGIETPLTVVYRKLMNRREESIVPYQ